MAGGGVVRLGVKLLKMALPVLKEVSEVILWKGRGWVVKVVGKVLKAARSFFRRLFRVLFEEVWGRVGGEDVRERIEQLKEEYEKWMKERKEECEK